MNLHRQPQVMASMNSLNIFGAGKVASTWWKPGTSIRQKYQSRKAWKNTKNWLVNCGLIQHLRLLLMGNTNKKWVQGPFWIFRNPSTSIIKDYTQSLIVRRFSWIFFVAYFHDGINEDYYRYDYDVPGLCTTAVRIAWRYFIRVPSSHSLELCLLPNKTINLFCCVNLLVGMKYDANYFSVRTNSASWNRT